MRPRDGACYRPCHIGHVPTMSHGTMVRRVRVCLRIQDVASTAIRLLLLEARIHSTHSHTEEAMVLTAPLFSSHRTGAHSKCFTDSTGIARPSSVSVHFPNRSGSPAAAPPRHYRRRRRHDCRRRRACRCRRRRLGCFRCWQMGGVHRWWQMGGQEPLSWCPVAVR